jgi:hypothetical protein
MTTKSNKDVSLQVVGSDCDTITLEQYKEREVEREKVEQVKWHLHSDNIFPSWLGDA